MKSKLGIVFSIVLISIIFISSDSFAGWTQPKGGMYNQISYAHYTSSRKYTTLETKEGVTTGNLISDKERIRTAKFQSYTFTYYSEYGITDTLTVFASIPFWKAIESDDTIRYSGSRGPSGLGDIDVGLRYNLFKNFLGGPLSLQGAVKVPVPEYENPLRDLHLGDGQYDVTTALFWGVGLGKGYAWILPGYKYRFENTQYYPFKPSDQIKVMLGGGYAITPKVGMRLLIDWAKSVGNASVSEKLIIANYAYGGRAYQKDTVLIRETLVLEPDILNVGASFVYKIKPNIDAVLSYNVDLGGFWIFQTRDSGVGEAYTLALAYSF